MEPQNAGPAPTSQINHEFGEHDQYLTVTGRPSAASSLRRMYAESTGTVSGQRTPDERTALLGDRTHEPSDTRNVDGTKQSVSGEYHFIVFRCNVKRRIGGPPTPAQRKNSRWQRIRYYIPATAWIPEYTLALLGGDVLGGVTVACMLIPQSVSYASSLAKLSPVTGLVRNYSNFHKTNNNAFCTVFCGNTGHSICAAGHIPPTECSA